MIRRPKADETEEDLLKQQAEYAKGMSGPPGLVNEPAANISTAPNSTAVTVEPIPAILGDVYEKCQNLTAFQSKRQIEESGFPPVFLVDLNDVAQKPEKKKSLFALKLERKRGFQEMEVEPTKVVASPFSDPTYFEIHQENVSRLESMSKEEILQEKMALQATLEPNLIQFLKDRGSKKTKLVKPVESKAENFQKVTQLLDNELVVKENLKKTLDEQWLEMDKIELSKLEWIGDIPDETALEPDKPYSARFDFLGELQPLKTDVDVRKSLHHHGEEPERAGYTIQELYQLSRSTVLQQRNIALITLANVIRKTKMGYYDSCFDTALLRKLVDSDVFFLLRFAMDDKATTTAAIQCLSELLVCRSDEVCLDRLQNVAEQGPEPYLFVAVETDKDSDEQELKDHQIIAQDLVRGVLRTDLIARFSFILNNFELDPLVIPKIFDMLIRVCRHSPAAGEKVMECSSLLSYIFDHLYSSAPCHQAVKLLRILAYNQNLAVALLKLSKTSFEFIFKWIDSDEPFFKLKLECLSLLTAMIRHSLLLDKVASFSSQLKRLLYFYVSKVNVDHGRFDFELFSGIATVLNSLAGLGIHLENDFDHHMRDCLLKWLTQLKSGPKFNFSVAKALGCLCHYFTLKFHHQGVTNRGSTILFDLKNILLSFFNCEIFIEMCRNLVLYSHIRHHDLVHRDPENLPSLCSVHKNGSDYLKLVQDGSAFPLVSSLINLVITMSDLSPDYRCLLKPLLSRFENYVGKLHESHETPSWFASVEVSFLISILRLMIKCDDPNATRFAFRLVPYFRTDDQRILEIIDLMMSKKEFSDVTHVYKAYVSRQFKPLVFHSGETFPRHWVYEPIASAPKETLKCISYILEHYPDLLSDVPPTLRYVHLCLVLLDSDNLFDADINSNLDKCLNDVIEKFNQLNLQSIVIGEKPFYELYRDLVNEYASSSYGHPLFAKVVTIPLAQKFDVSYRKLMWSEFIHALRVISLPKDVANFLSIDTFTSPVETDDSLLVLYLNAVSKKVLRETRNGFIYEVAVENVRKFLLQDEKDERLASILKSRILSLHDETLKSRLFS